MSSPKLETFISADKIQKRIQELASEINAQYQNHKGAPVLMVPILRGSFIFAADLMRALKIPVQVDFIEISSYGSDTQSSGRLTWHKKLRTPVEGRQLLIVEDIIDTGLTISGLLEELKASSPASVKVCALLHKPARQKQKVPIDFLGFTIEDHFVVGYGLDFDENFRELPEIAIVK
jgi:hypoxanthine phosphoribosyltransferase